MSIKAVLFDLDGTLLPMDQEVFVKAYFKGIATKLAPYGYESETLIKKSWAGTGAMIKNRGPETNETAFWNFFKKVYGEEVIKDEPVFDSFYRNEFDNVKTVCEFNPLAEKTVKTLKSMGLRLILATNPIFPAVATESRVRWAGLGINDFEMYTTYENCCNCKPNPEYYGDILKKCSLNPQECLMVGNDVSDDTPAESLGIKVFLLTDCLINKEGKDISMYPQGDFNDLIKYIQEANQ